MQAELYWIDDAPCGRLAIMPRPRSGDWLRDELTSWKDAGVDVVISALMPDEVADLQLDRQPQLSDEVGLNHVSFPIVDRSVPESVDEFLRLLIRQYSLLKSGRAVAVHCRMGIGRSSLVAACLLVMGGLSTTEAFERIARSRGVAVPDTTAQMEWVESIRPQLQTLADKVIPPNADVQQAAKQVLAELPNTIGADSTEHSIASFAAQRLAELGFPDTWYHQCPALVLLGDRSCLSVSGKDYRPDATATVGQHNLVTVDLSPCQGSLWGDCARSFVVEDDVVVDAPQDPELKLGQETTLALHQQIQQQVTTDFTFHDLFTLSNDLIRSAGYENLDFLGNVGHSIATRLDERLFVEADNRQLLTSVDCFTFEPHIRQTDGRWGFKHENIYYFDDTGRLVEL